MSDGMNGFEPHSTHTMEQHPVRSMQSGLECCATCTRCGHAVWGSFKSWDHDVQLEKPCRGTRSPRLIAASIDQRRHHTENRYKP